MTDVVKISSLDDLISSIPHTLGFTPAQSMVCVALGGGPIARLDLPRPTEDIDRWVEVLTDVYLYRHHPRRIALVAYGDDGPRCVEALAALSDALLLGGKHKPDVGPVVWVDGDDWTDLVAGTQGTLDPSSRARMDAEFAIRGRVMPAAGRDSLAAELGGDPDPVTTHLPAAREKSKQLDAAGWDAEAEWLTDRLHRFRTDRAYLENADAARVLTSMQHREPRNAVVLNQSREHAAVDAELWLDLVRRAPVETRDVAVTLLALSSYLDGRGAHAWVALDELHRPNPLSELVETALDQAVDPRAWDAAVAASTSTVLQRAALRGSAAQSPSTPTRPTRSAPPRGDISPDTSGPSR